MAKKLRQRSRAATPNVVQSYLSQIFQKKNKYQFTFKIYNMYTTGTGTV